MTETRVEFYEDQAGEWRWRIKAANNEIVAESGEGYKNRVDAEHGLDVALEAPDPDNPPLDE